MSGATLVTGATGFVGGHLLDHLTDRAPVVAWYRPDGQQPDPQRHLDWRPVDLLDADRSRRRHRRGRADAASITSPAPRSSPRPGTTSSRTCERTCSARITCSRPSSTLGQPCRVLVVSSAQVYQVSDEPLDENAPLVPPNPYGLSKLAQDQLAAARGRRRRPGRRHRAAVQSRRPATDPRRSRSRASRGRSRGSRPV